MTFNPKTDTWENKPAVIVYIPKQLNEKSKQILKTEYPQLTNTTFFAKIRDPRIKDRLNHIFHNRKDKSKFLERVKQKQPTNQKA